MEIDLENTLLLNGGCKVIFGLDTEHEINQILKQGKLYLTQGLKHYKKDMLPNQCHKNSAYLSTQKKSYRLITGYAMFDGEWISHSWLWNGQNIIETCPVTFEEYFGHELKGQDLDFFIMENY